MVKKLKNPQNYRIDRTDRLDRPTARPIEPTDGRRVQVVATKDRIFDLMVQAEPQTRDWSTSVIILKPLQNHDFSKIAKLVKNYTKKIVLAIFKFGSKLVKRYPKITFSLFSKLPKNYTKITNKIQIAPLRGASGIEIVIIG